MARNPDSFRVDEAKKQIILYTNVAPNEMEKSLIQTYITSGYSPKMEEKKSTMTVKQMRDDLSDDEEALKEFNSIYKSKAKGKGFFGACKYYHKWKKEHKAK